MSDLNENLSGESTEQETQKGSASVEPIVSEKPADSSVEPVITAQPEFSGPELISGVEPAKKKPIAVIIAVIVLVLALGSAAAYSFVPFVKNNVKMLLSKPEDYYLWVEEKNVKKAADAVSDGYEKILDASTQSEKEIELKADIDPANMSNLISELTGTAITESGITLPESIAIKSGASSDGTNGSAMTQLNIAGNTLMTVNTYIQDGILYYQIPDLSPAYVAVDSEQIYDETYSKFLDEAENAEFLKNYNEFMSSISKDPASLREYLTEDELNDLIVKYFTDVFENVKKVDIKKNVSCETGGIKNKYTKLSANVDQGTLFGIAKDVLKDAKRDDTIIKLIEKFGLTKDTYTAKIDELLDQMGSLEISGGNTIFTMNVYVNSSGVICGRDIVIPEREDVNIGYMNVKDGSETAFKLNYSTNDGSVSVSGKSKVKGKKLSGNAKLQLLGAAVPDERNSDEMEIPITYKDFEIVNDKNGYSKGELTIDLSTFEGPTLSVLFDSDGKSQTVKSDITIEGTNYGTLTLTSKDSNSMETPAFDSSQKVYKMTSDGAEMEGYKSEISAKLPEFLDNITSSFGLNGIGSILGGAMFAEPEIDTDDLTGNLDDLDTNIDAPSLGSDDAEVKYDLKNLNIQINNQPVVIPAKINGILSLVKVDDQQLEAGAFATYYNDEVTLTVSVTNNTQAAVAPADCPVTGITVNEGAPITFSIDGFTQGSDIADVAKKYGATLTDNDMGSITISDTTSEFNTVTFYYYGGKVDAIDYSIIEY